MAIEVANMKAFVSRGIFAREGFVLCAQYKQGTLSLLVLGHSKGQELKGAGESVKRREANQEG
jgi:hypothetical protein